VADKLECCCNCSRFFGPTRTPTHLTQHKCSNQSQNIANQHLDPGSEILPPRQFVNIALAIGSSYSECRSSSHDTLCQPSEIPVQDPMPCSSPSQRRPQSDPDPVSPLGDGATPPVDHLYTQIKEHAGFMVGLVSLLSRSFPRVCNLLYQSKSAVLGGVAINSVCSDKTKGHRRICYALSALRIYSLLLNPCDARTIIAIHSAKWRKPPSILSVPLVAL
jgi:hypothetical protein